MTLLKYIFAGFLIYCLFIFNSCSLLKHNRFKKGQQHGYWITYADANKKIVLTKGRFKNGVQKGKWMYNTMQGKKERIEYYKKDKIRISYFHPNGKQAVKGRARIVNDSIKLHFYYYGPWYFYNEVGQLQKISYFENGTLIREDIKIKTGTEVYDSLAAELIKLDRDFHKYSDTLQTTFNKFGAKSEEYKSVWKLNKENDSLIYLRIEGITSRFGYPERKFVGENNGIIFYIISFAPAPIKEKYLELFRSAAQKGEITLRDFAYFEDKYLVAKSGFQLYGTQFKTVKDYKQIYYPVKKLSDLNDRRKMMNLEPVNLLEYKESTD